jgi:hypothetical protein
METYEDLGAVLGTVDVDSEALIGRAVSAGRRRQRRRRVGAGAGVLAVGALIVGSGLHLGGSSVAQDSGVTDQPTTQPTTQPTAGGGSGRSDVPSSELTDARLAERLPVPGHLVSAKLLGGTVFVQRTLDPDGSGVGSVSLSLEAEKPLPPEQISGEAQKCRLVAHLNGPESCRLVPGGWMFTFTAHPDVENASPKALDWSATVNLKDGTSVQVRATNYVDQSDPTRRSPVLTLAKVEDLATDAVWFQPAS